MRYNSLAEEVFFPLTVPALIAFLGLLVADSQPENIRVAVVLVGAEVILAWACVTGFKEWWSRTLFFAVTTAAGAAWVYPSYPLAIIQAGGTMWLALAVIISAVIWEELGGSATLLPHR